MTGMLGARLGLKDLRREPAVFACFVIALAAVLGPLLVLYGLKHGIVTTMLAKFRERPSSLEIELRGNYSFRPADIEAMRALPGIGFLVAAPRTIAMRVKLEGMGENARGFTQAGAIPSAPGDPLLPRGRPFLGPGEVALTAQLAQLLRVGPGAEIVGWNDRPEDDIRLSLPLRVVHVFDREMLPGNLAMLPAEVLDRFEAFFDGFAVPELQIPGKPAETRPEIYETLRLYARTLDDIPVLDEQLTARGITVVSKAGDVRAIQNLDANLGAVFAIITLVGGTGYLLSLAVNLWANVDRKRRSLSVLSLLGARRTLLGSFPLVQALAVTLAGSVGAVLVYGAVAAIVNARFAGAVAPGERVCSLELWHFAVAVMTTLSAGAVAAGAGVYRVMGMQPTEALRDE